MVLVQKAYALATEIRTDPFATKRVLEETPEMFTYDLKQLEVKREQLVAKSVIGYGQVILYSMEHLYFKPYSLAKCTLPITTKKSPRRVLR